MWSGGRSPRPNAQASSISCARTRFGSSSMHGAHHDAQKLISTQRPLSDARLSVLPSRVTKLIDGAIEVIGPSPKLCDVRSDEHTSELQSLMRISYADFCLKKKNTNKNQRQRRHILRHT